MDFSKSLKDRVALVTGASRGIGSAIADTLGDLGATVIGTATSAVGAEKIAARFAAKGIAGAGRELDVTSGESVAALIEGIKAEWAAPAVLVNNAGITQDNLLMRMKEEEWQAVVDANLTAVFRLSRLCLRDMTRARWGRIINIGSVVGSMGNAGQCNYAATKAGIAGFARALAAEVGSRGVTVNTVAPGFIDTDMTKSLPDAQREALQSRIPLRRLGAPEEVAAVVAFLASGAGGYVTGETIHVNGGMYMA